MLGILAVSLATAACSGSEGMPQASAAEPAKLPAAEAVAPAVPAAQPAPAPVESKAAPAPRRSPSPAPSRPAARRAEAPAAPEYREFTLPAGTALELELRTPVGSEVSEVEDAVRATLRQAVRIDGRQVLPAGTELAGVVTDAERAGRVKGRARVAFRFNSLRYDGERYRIETEVVEQLGEASKGEDAKKIGIGAGAGAAIGALMGGGSGAAKGAAIGGAAGTGVVLATRGKPVSLEPGAEVSARLAAPVAIRVPVR